MMNFQKIYPFVLLATAACIENAAASGKIPKKESLNAEKAGEKNDKNELERLYKKHIEKLFENDTERVQKR